MRRPDSRSLLDARRHGALASVAGALAATDPNRAARLSAEAERAAWSITDEIGQAAALNRLAARVICAGFAPMKPQRYSTVPSWHVGPPGRTQTQHPCQVR
jgi:hypothetical protein